MNISELQQQTILALEELLDKANLRQRNIVVIGCSTSEVQGQKIGSAGSAEAAEAIFVAIHDICCNQKIAVAIQCCEHLNRALVVERSLQESLGLTEVTVIPVCTAGGALAAAAMNKLCDPVIVETIVAHAGLDIGCTLIGMHIKRVAVPIRLKQKYIGQALLTAAGSRPALIGGLRAQYERAAVKIKDK